MRKRFTKTKEAKRRARQYIGAPPRERVIPDKRKKPEKYQKNLLDNLENS